MSISLVVSNYKITKSESYSQHHSGHTRKEFVVSNYKITKSESYSQHGVKYELIDIGCI